MCIEPFLLPLRNPGASIVLCGLSSRQYRSVILFSKRIEKGGKVLVFFFRSRKGEPPNVFFKKNALFKRVLISATCPLFPEDTMTIVGSLPVTVNLSRKEDNAIWIQTKYRVNTRWLSRFPPIVPKSEEVYKKWLNNLLLSEQD